MQIYVKYITFPNLQFANCELLTVCKRGTAPQLPVFQTGTQTSMLHAQLWLFTERISFTHFCPCREVRGCFIQQPTRNPLVRVFEPDVGFEPTMTFRCLLTRQVQSSTMGNRLMSGYQDSNLGGLLTRFQNETATWLRSYIPKIKNPLQNWRGLYCQKQKIMSRFHLHA